MIRGRTTAFRQLSSIFIASRGWAVVVLLVIAVSFSSAALQGQANPPLTLDQVRSLVNLGDPDATIAGEIESRGIAFQPSEAILNELERLNAGPQTLAALRKRIPVEGAFLSVTTDYPDASVTIGGVGTYKGSASHVRCPPGTYLVHASRSGMEPVTRIVSVREGEDNVVHLDLVPDPDYRRMLRTVQREGAGRDAAEAPTGGPEGVPSMNDAGGEAWSTAGANMDADTGRLLSLVQRAMGGRARLEAIQSWQQRAKVIWEPTPWAPYRSTSQLTTMFASPSSVREDGKAGNRVVNFSDGQEGWTWASNRPVITSLPSATAIGMSLHMLPTLVLCDSTADCSAHLVAPGVIRFVGRDNNSVTLTVDATTDLPEKLSWRNLDGATLEETYSEWRDVGGVMWWFYMTRARDGKTFLEEKVKGYRINCGLTDRTLSATP